MNNQFYALSKSVVTSDSQAKKWTGCYAKNHDMIQTIS